MIIYAKGDFTVAAATSPLIPESPFTDEGDPTPYVYRQTFRQFIDNFEPLEIGTQISNGAYLVAESTPNDVGGGIGEWTRTYAKVPGRIITAGRVNHRYAEADGSTLFVVNRPVVSEIVWDFFYAPGLKWQKIVIIPAPKVTKSGGSIQSIAPTYYNHAGSSFTDSEIRPVSLTNGSGKTVRQVHKDSDLDQWMGPIYRRTTELVRSFNISTGAALG